MYFYLISKSICFIIICFNFYMYFFQFLVQIMHVCYERAVGIGTPVKPMISALISQDSFLHFQQGALDINTTAITVIEERCIWKDPPNTNHSSKTDIKSYHKRGQDFRRSVMLGSK